MHERIKSLFNKSLSHFRNTGIFANITSLTIFFIGVFVVINSTERRTNLYKEIKANEKTPSQPEDVPKLVPQVLPLKYGIGQAKLINEAKKNLENVWCEALAYKDLSSHQSIKHFQKWTEQLNSIVCLSENSNCSDHDPRFLHQFFTLGEKLAVERKPIFAQIIRGNPKQALELAISPELLNLLPHEITKNLEKWESGFADIRSMHLCFTEEHPGGYIKTTAQFPDGRNFRTWSFGNRSKLHHKNGLAVWGISLGEDLAISDKPVRVTNNADSTGIIEFAGSSISFTSEAQRDLVVHQIREAESNYRGRRGAIHQIKYPVALASSMSADSILKAKYDLNTTKVTFNEALSAAMSKNGSLLQIKDSTENLLILEWLKEQNEEGILFPGRDESNNSVNYVWLGATDNDATMGTIYDEETNTTTQQLEINADEGTWKWLNGEEFSYANWAWDTSNNETKDFAAIDWNDTNGTWVDINETARLPFVIEYDLEIAKIETDLKGIRKVLVVPARFVDETVYYQSAFGGSNVLLTNELGEEIMDQIKADPYEPATKATIQKAMDEVVEFYNRNTDGELKIIPVITSVVTLPHMNGQIRRYIPIEGSSDPNVYDSEGNFSALEEVVIQELPEDPDKPSIEVLAMSAAATASEDWDYEGFAFIGLSSIEIDGSSIDTNFSEPPSVALVGGEATTASGVPHPRFKPASVEVNLDSNGDVIGAVILESGEYYGSAPNILLNGIDYSDHFEIIVESLLISKVAITNYSAGAPGLGWIGAAGAHVQITDGQIDSGILAHEIGHNFGLFHANRYLSRSELVLNDDADIIEYGNPYSVMGGGKDIVNGGDLTASEKVAMNNFFAGGGGYAIGSDLGVDVIDLTNQTAIIDSPHNEFNQRSSNSFRIYRSDYSAPPRFLRATNFSVILPDVEYDYLNDLGMSPYNVRFVGTGEEANGSLSLTSVGSANAMLQITNGGRGFVEEPTVQIIDGNEAVILTLNPSWIIVANGLDFDQQAQLVSYADSDRWIRGARIKTPVNSLVRPLNKNADGMYSVPLTDYYVSYRTGVSEDGLVLEVTNNYEESDGFIESFMLDATPETPLNFDDAHLLLGTTYSDYDADVHITPTRKGGNDPMKYIECVINMGTVGEGEAISPNFDISISDSNPRPDDFVEISATVTDGNTTQYAYSWFINEKPLSNSIYLNQPAINYQFSDAGRYVIRVVVSDMKGAVASRNVVVTVEGDEKTNRSMVSGSVHSSQGFIQGARVVLERAPVIEHNVSLSGSLYDSFFVDGMNNPAQFMIDGEIAPQLIFRRGELHRFNFDKSIHGVTMSFLEKPENTPPRININMLSDPRADFTKGQKYLRNPEVTYKFNSAFSNYLTDQVGTYEEMLTFLSVRNGSSTDLLDDNGTSTELLAFLDAQNFTTFEGSFNLVSRPFAKALMQETNIASAIVGPIEISEFGYYVYGGRGYTRSDPPTMTVRRKSIWEDYSNTDAEGIAFVDGINTISPVNATEFLGPTWATRSGDQIVPQLLVFGAGEKDENDPNAEVNATIIAWEDGSTPMRTIRITNQGKGFEPNSTMAVLHYPTEPFAYWTFDRHESLFEDSNQARYQPSPAWNREHRPSDLVGYWTFDENSSSTEVISSVSDGASFSLNTAFSDSHFQSWGLVNKALNVASGESITVLPVPYMDGNITFSFWALASDDFNLDVGGTDFDFTFNNNVISTGISPLLSQIPSYWAHIAIVKGDESYIYVDGRQEAASPGSDNNITILNDGAGSLLIDEAHLYSSAISEEGVRYLAGRNHLDLSGNKFHSVPMGTNAIPTSPDSNMSSADVPSTDLGSLGDSYSGEDNGKSLIFDGTSQYLDLIMHQGEFSLPEGTISLWINPRIQQDTAPLFSAGSPYLAEATDGNATEFSVVSPGALFSLELTSGWPRMAGFRAFRSQDRISSGEWHHLVATFPNVRFWVNGVEIPTTIASSGNTEFEEYFDLINTSIDASFFRIGFGYDRSALDPLPLQAPEAYYDGQMDDFAIYNRILDSSEIKFLYELNKGREQIPRLEVVVDAVGTTIVTEGGAGYRENPDLIFWYGDEENKTDLNISVSNFDELEALQTENNTSHGALAYVADEETVYSFHLGKALYRQYSWRNGTENGWRKLIPAKGIGEYANASLGDVVWTKKLDTPVEIPMPDGRLVPTRYIDYVTMDENNSFSLERNSSYSLPHKYFKPNGLYGFVERVDLAVDSPTKYNTEAVVSDDTADAFVHFYIDNDANESISIVDPGTGVSGIPLGNVKISGPGYQPATDTQKEEEHPGFAEIDTDQSMAGTIYAGTGLSIYNWSGNEDVNISRIDFNKTYLSVSVDNPGFGYAMPVDFKVIGGRPTRIDGFFTTPLPEYNSFIAYDFEEAEFEVSSVSADGAIESIEITNMGRGYINLGDLTEDEREILAAVLREKGYDFSTYPFISIVGGGGHGALFKANIDSNGSITSTTRISGGRGYENVIPNNYPRAVHTPTLSADEKNASLAVMLGGYLKEIPRCTDCEAGTHDIATSQYPYSHLEPWIEIWDRGRSEEEIDAMGARAHAAPKVVNGEIVKVLVTNSGTGYIDPVVMVRDAPPKHVDYHTTGGNFSRTWKCTYFRTLPSGEKIQCGHIHVGFYPPEYCPGETDDTLPYEDENGSLIYATGSDLIDWKARHDDLHKSCGESEAHLSVGFLSRKCWGTKTNYILDDNAIYRNPRADWLELDANLTIISKNGKIREIVVDNPGSNYYATQIHVEGTGSGVDAIPVFDDFGLNTGVIFDDPRIKNLEMDLVSRPHGAGQGFRERPWAGDEVQNAHHKSNISDNPYGTEVNNPLIGTDERVDVIAIHSDDYKSLWNFGQPVMADYLGDRVLQVEVLDPGLYENSTELNVTLDYDPSGSLDKNRDGVTDFIAANVTGSSTTRVTKFVLDDNASYDENASELVIERGLFTENPRIQILDGRNFMMGLDDGLSYDSEIAISDIRNNDSISYDPNPDKSYIELYVDDRLPAQLYYGEGITSTDNSMVVPAFGGQILVTEGVPGGSWAVEESMEKPNFSYSDENGYFAFTNLTHGMYNLSVFMEDQKLQESTFRPTDNGTRISQFVYLPGFPDLLLETDNYGKGQSSLLWARESRSLSRSSTGPLDKVLAGIGVGFDRSKEPPELNIIPHSGNFISTPPNLSVTVLVDGSLRIEIVDTNETTKYFPGDKFTVSYSSTVTGVDFMESYLYSESNQTFKTGVLSSWQYDQAEAGLDRYQSSAKLLISPNDSDGANLIEATLSNAASGEVPNSFKAQVFDSDGTELDASQVAWKVVLDFNSSEGNNSNILQLEDALGNRDLNANGSQTDLYLFSTLRVQSGSIHGIEAIYGGSGYVENERIFINDSNGYGFEANITDVNETGGITQIDVLNRGFGYSAPYEIYVSDSNGVGARFETILPLGYLALEANFTTPSGEVLKEEVLIKASPRHVLSSQEKWLDLYLDSFIEKNSSWWAKDLDASNNFEDLDDDNLTNYQEWRFGSGPLSVDTDLDKLFDFNESLFSSSLLSLDTDRDGLNDYDEKLAETNPLITDSDGDGLSDFIDSDPNNAAGVGIISGRVFVISKYNGKTPYFRSSISADISNQDWMDSWEQGPRSYYLDSLNYGSDYTLQVFVDTNDSGGYDLGEPFIEHNISLSQNIYGNDLIPLDPAPSIAFTDSAYSLYEIDLQDSNLSNQFEWGVIATDPYYLAVADSSTWVMDSNFSNRHIEIDGNLTQYLLNLPDDGYDFPPLMTIDLLSAPAGTYTLRYKAIDSFSNYSNTIEQTVILQDVQAPFISIFDFTSNRGITTELNSTISQVYASYNDLNISYVTQQAEAQATLYWERGVPFELDELFIKARDNKSGEVDWNAEFLGNAESELLESQNLGTYDLNFTAQDEAGNEMAFLLTVELVDTHVPEISFSGESLEGNNTLEVYREIGILLEESVSIIASDSIGEYSSLTYFENNPSDFTISWGDLNYSTINDKHFILPGEESNYTLTFSFTDSSGNTGSTDLTIIPLDPQLEISATAMDGYLSGAEVFFGNQYSSKQTVTSHDGTFSLFFTDEEFNSLDIDNDGLINIFESKIIVSGGEDNNTQAPFLGQLWSDWNTTIVSPLTSLVGSLMEDGLSKAIASQKVSEAFNLDESIDIFRYDPYLEADLNDTNSINVLLANLRLANLFNQLEAVLNTYLDLGYYENGDISQIIFDRVAARIITEGENFDLTAVTPSVITDAMNSVRYTHPLSDEKLDSEDIEVLQQLVLQGDPSIVLEDDEFLNATVSTKKNYLLLNQKWSQEHIVDEMIENWTEADFQLSFSVIGQAILDVISIKDASQRRIRTFNLHAPIASNFRRRISPENIHNDCIIELESSDADGDEIIHSFVLGNADYDNDGISIFSLTKDGKLCLSDLDEISYISGKTTKLSLVLDDGYGRTNIIIGEVEVDSLLAFESQSLGSSWYHSSWLGIFNYYGPGWIYHEKLGWLYSFDDGSGSFWFWDPQWSTWWWSSEEIFPWIYRDDSANWNYLNILPEFVTVFDAELMMWSLRK